MKKVLCFLLVVLLISSVGIVPLAEETTGEPVGDGVYGIDWLLFGDVDGNQAVNAKDALEILKHGVGKAPFSEAQLVVGNPNGDDAINAKDALDVLKHSVGKLPVFAAGVIHRMNGISDEPEVPGNPIVEESFITTYDKSNSVNGAYTKDDTADTSFSLDISDLARNTCYSLSSGVWIGQSGPNDIKRLIFSLQGLVNRDYGMDNDHTSLIFVVGGTDDKTWLSEMQKEGSIMDAKREDGLKNVRITTYQAFMETFLPVIKKAGMILWDGDVPATANVAATICGLDGYLPVLFKSPLHKTLMENGVADQQSLVGLFKDGKRGTAIQGTNVASTGSAKNDAYLWAIEKYFDRCSSQYIGYTLDGAPTIVGYEGQYPDNPFATKEKSESNCLPNHDYLIARRAFFFDLAPYKKDKACDDPAQQKGYAPVGTDYETMIKLFARRYQRANGAFGALMGFPPWWLKYTDDNGSKDAVWNEWLFTEIITCYNMAKEADAAQPSYMYNGSVMYKYVPKAKNYQNNKKKENISFDKSTYYYTIYVGDYDSSAWLKKHIYEMWISKGGDKNLGNVSLMWSINPNLSDRIPVVFEYMFENKKDNHYFAGGDGGAGYVFHSALFQGNQLHHMGEYRPEENGDADNLFAAFSKKYYDRFQMDITGFLINGDNGGVTAKTASCINQYSPVGSFVNAGSAAVNKYKGTYYVNCYVGIDKSGAEGTMYRFAQGAEYRGLNFGAYRTICHTPTEIKGNVDGFTTYAAGKGLKVKYCDPYTYFDLLKQSGQGTELG